MTLAGQSNCTFFEFSAVSFLLRTFRRLSTRILMDVALDKKKKKKKKMDTMIEQTIT